MKAIDDSLDETIDPDGGITVATYHKHKIRLYRTMGRFLGRRSRVDALTSLAETRAQLINAYSNVPDGLKCRSDPQATDDRLLVEQMQAIALALTYDNLQLVLHRHLLFATQRKHLPIVERDTILAQLVDSALNTATLARHPVTQSIYVATHAAMHLGMCALSAGVVLCAVLLDQQSFPRRSAALAGVQEIVRLFSEHFVGRSYRLAEQAVSILGELRNKIGQTLGASGQRLAQDTFEIIPGE